MAAVGTLAAAVAHEVNNPLAAIQFEQACGRKALHPVEVLDRVEAHEQSETELMQRMFYNDIGEGD